VARCGRCKGRGEIRPVRGFDMLVCPDCSGSGEKKQKPSSLGKRTVSLGTPEGRCKVCSDRPAVEFHHVVAQHRLDRYLSAELALEAKSDIRNGVDVCRPCHDRIERGFLHLTEAELHPGFLQFIQAYDLYAALPRYMQEQAA